MRYLPCCYLLVVLLLVGLFTRCGDSPAATETVEVAVPTSDGVPPGTIVIDTTATTIYYTLVDELRIREAPDRQSRVLKKLPLGERLISLNEQSEEKITVNLRGTAVRDYWRKVKLEPQNGGKSLEGWVFGGALKEQIASYRKAVDGHYVRDINALPGEVVKRIVGVDVFDFLVYSGEINFRKTLGGSFVQDGPFELTGKGNVPDGSAFELENQYFVTYTGAFKDGKETGLFERIANGYEGYSEARIFYENGRCLWAEMKEEGEGMVDSVRQENPGSCTFRYLEDGLSNQ